MDRRGTEMAHEFAIERWDAAAVFLTTHVVLPQMLTSASSETQFAPSHNRLTGSLSIGLDGLQLKAASFHRSCALSHSRRRARLCSFQPCGSVTAIQPSR